MFPRILKNEAICGLKLKINCTLIEKACVDRNPTLPHKSSWEGKWRRKTEWDGYPYRQPQKSHRWEWKYYEYACWKHCFWDDCTVVHEKGVFLFWGEKGDWVSSPSWIFYCCSSVIKSCPSPLWPHGLLHTRLLCPPHLPEFAQICVHWVSESRRSQMSCFG